MDEKQLLKDVKEILHHVKEIRKMIERDQEFRNRQARQELKKHKREE